MTHPAARTLLSVNPGPVLPLGQARLSAAGTGGELAQLADLPRTLVPPAVQSTWRAGELATSQSARTQQLRLQPAFQR
jgi:hypothetical protein